MKNRYNLWESRKEQKISTLTSSNIKDDINKILITSSVPTFIYELRDINNYSVSHTLNELNFYLTGVSAIHGKDTNTFPIVLVHNFPSFTKDCKDKTHLFYSSLNMYREWFFSITAKQVWGISEDVFNCLLTEAPDLLSWITTRLKGENYCEL